MYLKVHTSILCILMQRCSERGRLFTCLIFVLILFFGLGSTTAFPADGRLYFGFDAGLSNIRPESRVRQMEVTDDSDTSFSLSLGYGLTNYLSLEAAYYDLGTADYTDSLQMFAADYSAYAIQALLHIPADDPGLSGFLKLGLGKIDLSGGAPFVSQPDSFNITGGMGLEYQWHSGVSIRGSYQYFDKNTAVALLGVRKQFGATAISAPPQPAIPPTSDSDGDGVIDSQDRCPETPVSDFTCPLPKLEPPAIPADDDGDGVDNASDRCPNTPPGLPVSSTGCVEIRDSDNDGIFDINDECPKTPKGSPVDAKGCTLVHNYSGVLEGVNFHYNSDRLTTRAQQILDGVAKELMQYPWIHVLVIGHTDDTGDPAYNKKLSLLRAKAVVRYLSSQGVAADRMRPEGRGEKSPVACNRTEAGRARNRRVEFVATED